MWIFRDGVCWFWSREGGGEDGKGLSGRKAFLGFGLACSSEKKLKHDCFFSQRRLLLFPASLFLRFTSRGGWGVMCTDFAALDAENGTEGVTVGSHKDHPDV